MSSTLLKYLKKQQLAVANNTPQASLTLSDEDIPMGNKSRTRRKITEEPEVIASKALEVVSSVPE
jgi:hypothetical protein